MALDFSQFGGVREVPDDPYQPLSALLNAQALSSSDAARVAAERADPFRTYKSSVAESLSRQLADPNAFQASAASAADISDPFRSYKPQVAGALAKLLENPGDVTTSPFYAFGRDQGIEAITRANKGVDSGKYMADLLKFGTGYAGQQFGDLAKLYNSILGGSSVAAGAQIAGQPAQTARLYNDVLGGSSVGGAQMLMGGFGRAQDQEAMAAAGRAASNATRGPQQQSSPSFDLNAMLSKYGINNGVNSNNMNDSPAVRGGTGIGPGGNGISPAGNYGLPTGGMDTSYNGGSWSSSEGGGGVFGTDYLAQLNPYGDMSYEPEGTGMDLSYDPNDYGWTWEE
jgi:hypothetical protein